MKRKLWIIIAVSMILVGTLLFFGAFSALDFDFKKLSNEKIEINRQNIEENFDSIVVNDDVSDIRIEKSSNGECVIDTQVTDNYKLSWSVKNGTLDILHTDSRKWYQRIGIFNFSNSMSLTLYLPEDEYDSLTIDSNTSDINISNKLSFNSVDIKSSTGDTDMSASVKGEFRCELDTGRINLNKAEIGSAELITSTGDIRIKSTDIEGSCRITTDTGDLITDAFNVGKLYAESTTGSKELYYTIAEKLMVLRSSTGDVFFDESDSESIEIETSTGDVEGVLLTSKVFITETSTGDIDVPKSAKGALCEIKTDTGDISVKIK